MPKLQVWWQNFAMSVMIGISLILSALTTLLVIQVVEHEYFPVVTGFTILDMVHTPDHVMISGTMQKVRQCRFVELVGYSGDNRVEIKFEDQTRALSRSTGLQHWGPWRVDPDVKTLRLEVRHQCHTFWDTTTDLVKEARL